MTASTTHITINGDLGSGKSTLANMLANHLGLELVQAGALQRSIAAERRLTTLQANQMSEHDESWDRIVDERTSNLARKSQRPLIFDSRMAWHFVPNSFKIRLIANHLVAANRIFTRRSVTEEDYRSIDHAVDLTRQRATSESKRYRQYYGVDLMDPSNYDLIIDTSYLTSAEVLLLTLSALGSPRGDTILFLHPKQIYASPEASQPHLFPIRVEPDGQSFVAHTSGHVIEHAQRSDAPILRATLWNG